MTDKWVHLGDRYVNMDHVADVQFTENYAKVCFAIAEREGLDNGELQRVLMLRSGTKEYVALLGWFNRL